MAGKIYFVLVGLFIFFTNRYQFITAAYYGPLEYLSLLRDLLLLLGGLSYFFGKKVLDKKHWKYVWWFLLMHLGISFIKQLLPGSYYGDLEDGQIGANILALLLSLILFIPLYISVFNLQTVKVKSNRK